LKRSIVYTFVHLRRLSARTNVNADPTVVGIGRPPVSHRRRAQGGATAGRLFPAHLLGVAGILEAWQQPPEIVLAGLLHSVYSTEMYPWGVFGFGERAALAALVGREVERTVFLYCTVSQRFVYEQVGRLSHV
jgi:hypothetical protein